MKAAFGKRATYLSGVRETPGNANGADGVEPISVLDEVKLNSTVSLRDGVLPLSGVGKIVTDEGNTVGVIGKEAKVIQELSKHGVGVFRRGDELVIEDVMQQCRDADEREIEGRGCSPGGRWEARWKARLWTRRAWDMSWLGRVEAVFWR